MPDRLETADIYKDKTPGSQSSFFLQELTGEQLTLVNFIYNCGLHTKYLVYRLAKCYFTYSFFAYTLFLSILIAMGDGKQFPKPQSEIRFGWQLSYNFIWAVTT